MKRKLGPMVLVMTEAQTKYQEKHRKYRCVECGPQLFMCKPCGRLAFRREMDTAMMRRMFPNIFKATEFDETGLA